METLHIKKLFDHMMWADAEIWKNILSFDRAVEDQRIKQLLFHMHQVQYAFYSLWDNFPMKINKLTDFQDLKSIAEWGFEYQTKLKNFLSAEDKFEKDRIIEIPWSIFFERRTGGKAHSSTLQETMLQVASHSSYHRGQINTRIREIGGEPAMVDFIVWIWNNKPEANWTFLSIDS